MSHHPSLSRSSLVLCLMATAALAACGGKGGADDEAAIDPSSTLAAAGGDATTSDAGGSSLFDAMQNALGRKTRGTPAPAPAPSPAPAPAPAPAPTPVVVPAGQLWSDPASWGGTVPTAGTPVVVAAGKTIVLDTDTPPLGALKIEGTLTFADKNVTLTAASINVAGALNIGSPEQPFVNKATITLNGAPTATNDGVARGLIVDGGKLAIHGVAPVPAWTKLNNHAAAGATSFTLADSVNWAAGNTIAVAPTDFYGVAETERLTLASASGTLVTTSTGVAKYRWGKLQYVTASGLSLTPDPTYAPPVAPAPTTLDERAAVANLSRNIVIQGADDAAWQTGGFGVHLMVKGLASKVVIDGVEIKRGGQAGKARFPIYWNGLSYSATGQVLGDAAGHIVKNSAVWDSANRCVVIRATNGVQVLNNICQDIKGHAFMLEEAVERRNVFQGNLALKTRAPLTDKALQTHENDFAPGGPAGASGFFMTNPDDVVRNNLSGDNAGTGFWMGFPRTPLGASAAVPFMPDRLPLGVFEGNIGHTTRTAGLFLGWAPIDAAGTVRINRYAPTADGSEFNYENAIRFAFKRITAYKNLDGAYRNWVAAADYEEWVTADNVGTHFAGAGIDGKIARGVFIGTSLNNLTPYPNIWPFAKPAAFATYHSTFSMRDNTVINFPFVEGNASGMMRTDDYYLVGVDKGPVRNPNNRLINTNAGYRILPPNMDGQPLENRNWTFSGALWDPHGYWGTKGNYWVYDTPFLTGGGNCQPVVPAGKNGQSCSGEYYGVGDFTTDFDNRRFLFAAPMDVVRSDAAGTEIGRWTVGDGDLAPKFANMRHFAARAGSTYTLRFPGKPLPKQFAMAVDNAFRSGDTFLFSVSFDGSVNATGYTVAGYNYQRDQMKTWVPTDPWYPAVRFFKPAASLNEVASSSGDMIWQDRANNLVWIKFQGGLPYPSGNSLATNSDDDLYRRHTVSIYPR